ncbi:STY4851/ECs_5259 family protein [Rugamonas sp. DEMB1]|uniref:STY4851/ECs_5259 family protein n=1 Tax=Rugamonas sp. DEMB1 TaxID=3039386 RepID=UPI0024478FD1|nr:STY4851/ECs_5259 family protein [Rugamonas sp. DEMB1]WGG51452.1 STY4851/ECs_5259 family protein [Rugamonas sp. DEMB1]
MTQGQIEAIFTHWLAGFFSSRNLSRPDGRQLFAYHLSDVEYADLKQALRAVSAASLGALCDARSFKAAWFLFAAEWWKRCYAGGAWGWSGLFDAIPLAEPGQVVKQAWVMNAREFWRLVGTLPNARPYLGQVILNGGIPERLLEEAQGRIAALLRLVLLRLGRLPMLRQDELLDAVREQQHLLPRTYREESIFSLFAAVVETILALRNEFQLAEAADPLARLEARCPDWKLRFPLRLDGHVAQSLLTGLVNDAVAATRGTRTPFFIHRGVGIESTNLRERYCQVDVVPRMKAEAFVESIGIAPHDLPQSFDIAMRSEGSVVSIGRGVVIGDEVALRIERTQLPGCWFSGSVSLELSRYGGLLHACDVPGSDAPDTTLPWILIDTAPMAQVIRTGSSCVRNDTVLLSVPSSARIAGSECLIELLGSDGDRNVYRLFKGECRVAQDGDYFDIRTGASDSAQENFLWQGKRLYLDSDPSFVFVAKPRLVRVGPTGEMAGVSLSQVFWRQQGVGNDRSLAQTPPPTGLGLLRWVESGKLQSRLKAVCLPEGARIRYCAGTTPHNGSIKLDAWPASSVAVEASDNHSAVVRKDDGENWTISLDAVGTQVPADITLQIGWHGQGFQRLVLPFPSQGVVLSDQAGKSLQLGGQIRVQDLLGARARLLSSNPNARWLLTLSLRGIEGNSRIERRFAYHRASGESALREIRLFELMPTIAQMLASVEALDVCVEARFDSDGKHYDGFRVARYAYDVVPDKEIGTYCVSDRCVRMLAQESLRDTSIRALPLQHPDQDVQLLPVEVDDIHSGAWAFNPENRASGNWLIYPTFDSPLPLRPLAWKIGDPSDSVGGTPLKLALSVRDKRQRLNALALALAEMAEHPGHQDWSWVEGLSLRIGHLPLSSLDLWIAMARVPQSMIMAHLRVDGFAERISQRADQELPFEWAFTSPIHWQRAIRRLKAVSATKSEVERLLDDLLLQGRLQLAKRLPSVLSMSLTLAQHELDGKRMSELDRNPQQLAILAAGLLHSLYEGDSAALQRLIRRPETDQDLWPSELNTQVQRFSLTPSGKRLFQEIQSLHDDRKFSVIALPFLLAYEAAAGETNHWRESPNHLAALRGYRDFDPYWFDEAYQCAMQCALCDGQIKTEV